ncbi:hypothetical protein KMC57_gp04 [Achromobacter phage vB_AxyP_19-32_Axy24]|uniref:YspA cpYpsA-related SLOG domain-containing protein n=2 Tax=Dongdastvirus TaxID=2842653 RepID=A0A514CUG9_9CAUD|nr:hypothetical protein KMC56_gp04 [Achromobacter phage vB_AxyP_19-32_Axy12]YP_010079134.1 hypothetical protein KMC57_gp04 [Achromobacter phage vB_AxyP_19-32_Axy24]QDH84124.1 hypothetical protein Axy12_004 [Achromobacter phage vB_AxyP_19-32_Axy12]QDH84768.1 hypothetical protein Axy24_004 [Achromobacter phage vB_AxyP_19-32_Axy24]
MKLIIAGGRDFTNTEYMMESLVSLLNQGLIPDSPVLVCGMARGADLTAHDLWSKYGMEIIEVPADWATLGRSAGHIRNAKMGKLADACVAFWDGKSSGTKGMIDYMNKAGKPCWVFNY